MDPFSGGATCRKANVAKMPSLYKIVEKTTKQIQSPWTGYWHHPTLLCCWPFKGGSSVGQFRPTFLPSVRDVFNVELFAVVLSCPWTRIRCLGWTVFVECVHVMSKFLLIYIFFFFVCILWYIFFSFVYFFQYKWLSPPLNMLPHKKYGNTKVMRHL